MNSPNLTEITRFVEENISGFHERRLQSLQSLKLEQILKRKNPYLFRAKNIIQPQELVESLLEAHLSSQEEAIFGDFLERLAIFVCNKAYRGRKSAAEGIDLEFERNGVICLVAIKSGPNWGNSSQIKKMVDNFKKAQRTLRTSGNKMQVIAINGCCYGRDKQPDKGDYQKLCGQAFWEFISGNEDLYMQIIEPLGHRAKQKNDQFYAARGEIVFSFTREIMDKFCSDIGLDWEKLLKFNSAKNYLP